MKLLKYKSYTSETHNEVLANTNLWIHFGVTLTSVMGIATVAPSLRGIICELQASSSAVAMVLTAYTLPGVVLAPLFDRHVHSGHSLGVWKRNRFDTAPKRLPFLGRGH